MRPDLAWIVHDNCRKGCPHCFCKPADTDDVAATEDLARDLERHGIAHRIYFTDQLDARLPERHSMVLARPGAAEFELRSGVHRVGFSLHGPDRQTHELLAPPGDFDAVVSAMERIRRERQDVGVEVFTVVHAHNAARFGELADFARGLGAQTLHAGNLTFAGRARSLPDDFFLGGAEIARFLRAFPKVRRRARPLRLVLGDSFGPTWSRLRRLSYRAFLRLAERRFCACGEGQVAIKARTREVFPCRFTSTFRELSIGRFDAEQGLVLTERGDLRESIGEPCRSCGVLDVCRGGCRMAAVADALRREGQIDPDAGFRNCPVALGATRWIDPGRDLATLAKILRRCVPRLRALSAARAIRRGARERR
ncbi:MAG: SPASM domain-containing protein [Planctomycetes bacterium]|nr:SPASM domain-containing protein [Planctomycetota bacterium]